MDVGLTEHTGHGASGFSSGRTPQNQLFQDKTRRLITPLLHHF